MEQPTPGSDPVPPPSGDNAPPPVPPIPPTPEPPPPPLSGAAGYSADVADLPAALPVTKEESTWAIVIHLSGLLGFTSAFASIPAGSLVIPLILWLVKRTDSAYLDDQGKEAVNFHITMALITAALIATCIGVILIPVQALYILIVSVIAAVKCSEGKVYRYPATLRLLK